MSVITNQTAIDGAKKTLFDSIPDDITKLSNDDKNTIRCKLKSLNDEIETAIGAIQTKVNELTEAAKAKNNDITVNLLEEEVHKLETEKQYKELDLKKLNNKVAEIRAENSDSVTQ